MSENKKTKAELIRDEIDKRRAKSDDPIRPRDIIAALESRGIKVAAPQVSVALRDFDKPKTDKAAKTSKASTPEATTKTEQTPKRAAAKVRSAVLPKSASAANEPSYAALESAASFVKGSGGLETARQLLDAYARLFNPAG
jgi:arginine repressor